MKDFFDSVSKSTSNLNSSLSYLADKLIDWTHGWKAEFLDNVFNRDSLSFLFLNLKINTKISTILQLYLTTEKQWSIFVRINGDNIHYLTYNRSPMNIWTDSKKLVLKPYGHKLVREIGSCRNMPFTIMALLMGGHSEAKPSIIALMQ